MDLSNFIKSEEGVVEFEKLPTPGLSAESINLSSNHERRPEFQPEQATRVKIPKILIVDDEESNIRLLKAMLLSENYKLIDVLSGKAALKAVNDFDPDLILLDVMMPQIDGFEVCRILKQDEKTRIIPVIIVTALNEKKHRIKAMEVGADDFLSKPVDRPELLVRVKSLLRIKAYHDELLDSLRIIAGKNDKLQKLEKIKDGLTHMIVHDLRNPLAAISGKIELFLIKNQSLAETQRAEIKSCLACCDDLSDMIQGLLDVHKMEENKLRLNKKLMNPAVIIEEVIGQLSQKAEAKQQALFSTLSEDSLDLEIDRGLIKRVISNLIANAIRHTPAGGEIEVFIEPFLQNKSVCVGVRDSGDGLAFEYHQKIFERFEQAALKRAGVKTGSCGLGLAFCKMAVEAHGGAIWVESEGEGKGSTFRFTIPIIHK